MQAMSSNLSLAVSQSIKQGMLLQQAQPQMPQKQVALTLSQLLTVTLDTPCNHSILPHPCTDCSFAMLTSCCHTVHEEPLQLPETGAPG